MSVSRTVSGSVLYYVCFPYCVRVWSVLCFPYCVRVCSVVCLFPLLCQGLFCTMSVSLTVSGSVLHYVCFPYCVRVCSVLCLFPLLCQGLFCTVSVSLTVSGSILHYACFPYCVGVCSALYCACFPYCVRVCSALCVFFFFDSTVEWILRTLHRFEIYSELLHLVYCFHMVAGSVSSEWFQ